MNPDLKDKIVVVAGGAKNLGGLISRQLAQNGASGITIHYNSDATREDAIKTAEAVKAAGAEPLLVQADLSKPAEVTRLFDETLQKFGKIDIAINTVGKVLKKPIAEITEAEYDSMNDINAKSAFFFMQEAGKKLADQGKLITVVTSLLGAFTGFYSTYAGSKAAVEHYTRAAAHEFGPRGISVNSIAPGPMNTPFFFGQESPEAVAYHSSAPALHDFTPTGLTEPKDIVPLVEFLATAGWWITGQTLLANGGYTTK